MSVAIIMGSSSDSAIMDDAVQTLRSFNVPVEVRVLSAHRTPDDTIAFARGAAAPRTPERPIEGSTGDPPGHPGGPNR
jgi:phosphoribosylcarboxyaminoimidazole (NCAIR) mutase